MKKWKFWIDRGGTFTDVVARRPDGTLAAHKVLSEHPTHEDDAALRGMRAAMDLPADAPLPAEAIAEIKIGTTVATNALLERTGTPTVFVTTQGFRDALRIGYQARPDIFARRIERPEMLYARVVEVGARHDAKGGELRPVDAAAVRADLDAAYAAGCRACAVCLMHGYRTPAHEEQVASIAEEVGFEQVSASHAVSPLVKLVGRGDTTVVDAYVSPGLRRYVARLFEALRGVPLQFMQSSGGLIAAEQLQGKDALLSGPAGGIVGAVTVSRRAGFEKIISFDMGGTSTDVTHYGGQYERTTETEIAGVRLRTPVLQIHTVAAGGGSICRYDGARYRVGPASAGADPGPASYGRGGPLTVTDCNVMVGTLQPAFFPQVFGEQGDARLDAEAVQKKFAALTDEIGDGRAPEAVAEGFLQIAIQTMAQAIRKVSLERGHDPRRYALCVFGGAGGQHACRLADALGIERVLIHPHAGVLSAYGMGVADVRALKEKTVAAPLAEERLPALEETLDELAEAARADVGGAEDTLEVALRAQLRYEGTDAPLEVDFTSAEAMKAQFEEEHRRRYGFVMAERPLAVESVAAEAVRRSEKPAAPLPERGRSGPPAPAATAQMYSDERWHEAPVFQRANLQPDDTLTGPAIIAKATGTTVVEPGWQASVSERGDLVLEPLAVSRQRSKEDNPKSKTQNPKSADPVELELFVGRFRGIAEHMGTTLQNTSYSVNIKERLDFSCALFDADGRLVANAPHIPVHLGSMGASVRSLLASHGSALRPGDVYVQNNPFSGGTHLPDVTVITPVFDEAEEDILFFVASRGHHADIGGVTPGSMPPQSTSIEEEGVLIGTMKLVEDGRFLEEAFRAALAEGPHPARNPDQNVADVQAQIAANRHGAAALRQLVETHGRDGVQAYMQHVQANAEASVRRVIGRLSDGAFTCALDTGEEIRVAVTVDAEAQTARIDFSGTAGQLGSNFNAPSAIVRAAVLYVFRTLVEDDIPLNEGCLTPLEIVIPDGSMLDPQRPAAVVAGNVETSQLVVDALYGALGAMAAAQGTMNNVTFGTERYQYYETIGGGMGAGPDFDGASAVQCHMTNSRLTDPEVLEARFPVLVEHFGLREGSGGAGVHRGGDGAVRRLRFREAMTAAILSGRRGVAPFGLKGGQPGAAGRNAIARADGTVEELPGTATVEVQPGDVLIVETPGGGGYGARGD